MMQGLCWHVAAKMSLGFLCLFLVFSTGKDNGKLFLSLFLHFPASCIRKENKKEKQVAVLATAELPAKSLDLAAINLTELVNGMLSTALRGTKKLFSLLSVTSYSSFAFHKVSVTIYNISNAKNIDPGKFPMHYCYCLNNVTNDLTDFTALLVDIIGNSSSYLTEIFKSTSILSVRQSNDSDCIYICVMAGQTGKRGNLSDFFEILEKTPVINYTFSSNTSSDLGKYILGNKRKQEPEDPNKTLDSSAEHVWTFKCEQILSDLNLPSSLPTAVKQFRKLSTNYVKIKPKPCRNISISAFVYENSHIKMFSVKFLNVIGAPCVSMFKMKWRSARSGAREALRGQMGFSGWILDIIVPQCVAVAAAVGHQHSQCAVPSLCLSCFCSYQDPSRPERGRNPHHEVPTQGIPWDSWPGSESCFSPGCPQALLREPRVTSPPVTLVVQKINPCVMELCRFFQLCLCVGQRRYSRKEAMRYCVEYYSWFVKNASYVCEKVKRVAYSHTLKQKCLKNICTSV
ncbi:HHLA1 protein, partial [Dicaeum eximium]|nr:HHLA1 protein [Dicaeum eximium]